MSIIVVGLNHRTADIEMRERFAFPREKLAEGLKELLSIEEIREGIILSTCNRVEVYCVIFDPADGEREIKTFLSDFHNVPLEKLELILYTYKKEDAVRHVFRVASSLDSMVLGEPQILGQIKDAYSKSLVLNTTGVILNRLIKKAISVAKKVRTETRIGENAVSISYVAVELAKKIFEDIHVRTSMLLGAGDMAELAARHLLKSGVKGITVANRTYGRAVELAAELKGTAVKWEDFLKEMLYTDIVICSTGASGYVFTDEQARRLMKERRHKPIFIIDISVPRNIDPAVNEIDNIYLYNIDDLQDIVDSNILERRKEAEAAEGIVGKAVESFLAWEKSLEAVPTIVEIKERMEVIRKEELEKIMNKLNGMSEREIKIVEALTASIVNKILHPSLSVLKEEIDPENRATYIYLARRLFGLDREEGIGEDN
ncbi:MAG: glutamyl-tRNA reductase [Nitrospirota bacterium]